jgi:ABC-2 type transport system ATP-binding protein
MVSAPSINISNKSAGASGLAIQAVNLTKKFGTRTSVDHLSFSVRQGELYALLGDNGAGKTTTINMLTTLLSPTEGEFFIAGHNGMKESEKCKDAFGVVSQDVAIYQELTAYENLAFIAELYGVPKAEAQKRIVHLLVQAGLADRAHDQAGEFSTGMQRKLSIACAVLHTPPVLFMDEPTVGLDPVSRRHIWEMLQELREQGVTILLTTHYLEEAELLADRIGIIRRGKLVMEGTIDQLRQKIQAIRSVSIDLSRTYDDADLKAKIEKMKRRVATEITFDPLRNTLFFAQPKFMPLIQFMEQVVAWLAEENLSFDKFSTCEPSLEEVFIAVTSKDTDTSSQ